MINRRHGLKFHALSKPKMSELRATVEKDKKILEVYFDANGVHYFHVRKYEGVGFGQYFNGKPILSSRIIKTETREEVLGISKNFDSIDQQKAINKVLSNKDELSTEKLNKKNRK